MNRSKGTRKTLEALAQMPFLDCIELAGVSALPERTARYALRQLRSHGHIEALRHTRSDASRVQRYCLTPSGIRELLRLRTNTGTPEAFIAEYDLTSKQGRRYLVRRLDAVESLYRIARDAAIFFVDGYNCDFAWRWERQGALDAMMQLPGGRAVAISRIGSTHAGKAIISRLGTLQKMRQRGDIQTTLLLVPGVVELERALNYMYNRGIDDFFIASEPELLSSFEADIWNAPDGEMLSLTSVLKETQPVPMPRTRRPEERRTMPSDALAADVDETDLEVADLGIPERRLMRLLYDWPFIRVSQMQRMMGISQGHFRRAKASLSRARLVHHLRIGGTPNRRYANGTRLVLSWAGLNSLRRVDRSSPLAMGSWFVDIDEGGDETFTVVGHRVDGNKARMLLKERLHTDGIYQFVSLLAHSCRASMVWDLVQALPTHRWERRYRYGVRESRDFPDVFRAIRPDATFVLKHPDRRHASFVLEFERRAKNPSTIAPKIEKYRTYYASSDTRRDFLDGRPTVLFVFKAREDASKFARHAATDGGSPVPMLVSSLDDLESAGSVFRDCWLMPWRLDEGYRGLSPLT